MKILTIAGTFVFLAVLALALLAVLDVISFKRSRKPTETPGQKFRENPRRETRMAGKEALAPNKSDHP